MSLLGWVIIGALIGFLTGHLLNGGMLGRARDVLLGVLGASIGGGLFTAIWPVDAAVMNVPSLICAIIGAVVMLGSCHLSVRGMR